MYVLPSVSTFTNRNPSFTRFQYDRDTFELLDYTVGVLSGGFVDSALLTIAPHCQVYLTNLSQTNARDAVEFVEFYTATSYFGMSDLSPKRCNSLSVCYLLQCC
jgi:hypothetical protein